MNILAGYNGWRPSLKPRFLIAPLLCCAAFGDDNISPEHRYLFGLPVVAGFLRWVICQVDHARSALKY